jgi:hypothetical protein
MHADHGGARFEADARYFDQQTERLREGLD